VSWHIYLFFAGLTLMVRHANLIEQAVQLANARADLLGEIARVHLAGVSGSDQINKIDR
jgi:hypothetical protein